VKTGAGRKLTERLPTAGDSCLCAKRY